MEKALNIPEHIKNNQINFNALSSSFPKLLEAAECINDLFDQLYAERFQHDNQILWQFSTAKMLFGIHSCWINYFIQSAQGYNDIGIMIGRRAIEYTCFISKIKGRDSLAKLWNEKTVNKEKLSSFNNKFTVPQKYFSSKYSHLKPLLVFHNYASEFGVHGNHASLVSKFRGAEYRNKISMCFQDKPEGVPHSTITAVQIGSYILDALLIDLEKNIRSFKEFRSIVDRKNSIIDFAINEVIKFTDENLDPELANNLKDVEPGKIDELFNELRDSYNPT
jgi:hypothetical protein